MERLLIVSRRVFLTLPDGVAEDLDSWALSENNKAATLAGFIVEKAVREAKEQGKIPDSKPSVTYKTIAEMVATEWDKLTDYGRIPANRLEAMKKGDRPTELDNARLALALGLDEGYVERLSRK
jgi:hypothetical protein